MDIRSNADTTAGGGSIAGSEAPTTATPTGRDGGGRGEGSNKPKLQLPASCEPPQPGQPPAKQLVWIVFGGTGHMGRSLVKSILSHSDLVTTVGRVFETTPAQIATLNSDSCLGTLCDVRDYASVSKVMEKTLDRFGRIDCIANCSGYGVIGACEDQDEYEVRNQFETNFMGTLHILQASLPYFRQQNGGRYLIFSSTSGALGVPGLGPYCATKYAVEGLIEAMLYEVDSFGIKATLVEPGLVRRDEPAEITNSLPTWGHFLIKPASEPITSALDSETRISCEAVSPPTPLHHHSQYHRHHHHHQNDHHNHHHPNPHSPHPRQIPIHHHLLPPRRPPLNPQLQHAPPILVPIRPNLHPQKRLHP